MGSRHWHADFRCTASGALAGRCWVQLPKRFQEDSDSDKMFLGC